MNVQRTDESAIRLIRWFVQVPPTGDEVAETLDAVADVIKSTGRLGGES